MTTVRSSPLAGAEMMTFLAPASMWPLAFGGVGEEAGGLDDDVDAQVAPGQLVRAALGERLDLLLADDDGVVAVERDVVRQAAQDRVVLEQVGQGRVVGQVVDRHDLDVGGAERLLRRPPGRSYGRYGRSR